MKVKGLVSVTNALKKYGDKIAKDIADEVHTRGANIERDAQQRKPSIVDLDSEQGAYSYSIQARVGANTELAAYLEFGTGKYAAQTVAGYPSDVGNLAMKFYVDGSGKTPAQPYLIPAYLRERKAFLKNIRKIVKSAK